MLKMENQNTENRWKEVEKSAIEEEKPSITREERKEDNFIIDY